MNNQVSSSPDHEEVFSLLPWYVNQTLDGQQRRAVSSHIENCDECQREIQFLTALNDTVQSDAQTQHNEHADINRNFASVMDRIDSQSQHAITSTSALSLLRQKVSQARDYFSAQPFPQWSTAALACCLVAVLGFQLFFNQPDDNYSVLSSSDISDSSMRLSVELSAGVSQEQLHIRIQSEMENLGRQIDIETGKNEEYILVFRDAVGVTELSNLIADLEKEAYIQRVEILSSE